MYRLDSDCNELLVTPGHRFRLLAANRSKGLRRTCGQLAATLFFMIVATQASAQTFSITGNMSIHRDSATATELMNGKVLIAGGYDGNISRGTAELYDQFPAASARPAV